uniref:Uncharacterized protein n=1 Tax=Cucumis melo TaxID=3656 RepID=A0A9I9E601_CUCME
MGFGGGRRRKWGMGKEGGLYRWGHGGGFGSGWSRSLLPHLLSTKFHYSLSLLSLSTIFLFFFLFSFLSFPLFPFPFPLAKRGNDSIYYSHIFVFFSLLYSIA